MIKASLIGLATVAFVVPVLLFLAAALLYRRYRQHRTQQGAHIQDIGDEDKSNWHPELRQKSDAAKLAALEDHPVVIVEGKRSASRASSASSSSKIGVGGVGGVAGSSGSGGSSASSSRCGSPETQASLDSTASGSPVDAAGLPHLVVNIDTLHRQNMQPQPSPSQPSSLPQQQPQKEQPPQQHYPLPPAGQRQ